MQQNGFGLSCVGKGGMTDFEFKSSGKGVENHQLRPLT